MHPSPNWYGTRLLIWRKLFSMRVRVSSDALTLYVYWRCYPFCCKRRHVIQEIAADHGGPIDIKETEPMRSQLLESILNGDYDRTENEEISDISH